MKIKVKKKTRKLLNSMPLNFPADYSIHWSGDQDRESGITCSMIYQFLRCRVAYKLSLHKYNTNYTSSGLAYGSLFHYFLEKLYASGDLFTPRKISTLINKFVHDNPNMFIGLDGLEITRLKTLAGIMGEMYQEFYEKDFNKYKFISLEGEFDINWNGYRLRGKRDGIVEDTKDRTLLWENKNFWNISHTIETELAFDLQCMFYINALEHEKKIVVPGCVYNITRVPQDKMSGSELEYRKKIKDKVEKQPSYYFVRYNVEYTKKQKIEFIEMLTMILSEIDSLLRGDLPCYRNNGGCVGKYRCKFMGACSTNSMSTYIKGETRFPELNS